MNFALLEWTAFCLVSWQILIIQNMFLVFLELQWALPVQGQHCIRINAVLQPKEWEHFLHVGINFHINHYALFFLWLISFVRELFLFYTCRSENVLTYKETPRISFFILVTNPVTPSMYIPKKDLEAAIRWGTSFIHKQVYLDYIQGVPKQDYSSLVYPLRFADFQRSCSSQAW